MERDEILRLLGVHLEEIQAQFGVRSLSLFGSTAREEAQPSSDVDILVEFQDTPTFRGYMQLRIYLEDLLGAKVDLITESGLRDTVRPYVERDAIRVA
jgi:predicted nucleotidyltransferase